MGTLRPPYQQKFFFGPRPIFCAQTQNDPKHDFGDFGCFEFEYTEFEPRADFFFGVDNVVSEYP